MHLHSGVQRKPFAAQPHGGEQAFVQPQTVSARMAFDIGGSVALTAEISSLCILYAHIPG